MPIALTRQASAGPTLTSLQSQAVFATVTNTNLDAAAIQQFLWEAVQVRALAILLTLLYLNVQNIKLGLSLPAFVSPAVWQVLMDKFKIGPITNVEADLAEALGK
jgi:hypothetical protein